MNLFVDENILFIVMAIVYIVFFSSIFIYIKKSKLEERFKSIYDYSSEFNDGYEYDQKQSRFLKNYKNYLNKKEIMLEQANIRIGPLKFVFYTKLVNTILSIVASYLIGVMYLIPVCWFMFSYLTNVYIKTKIKRRQIKCEKQLISAIRLMGGAIGAGSSPVQALSKVGYEAQEPIRSEFNKIIADLNYGVSYSDSFRKLYLRLPTKNFNLFANTMIIQRDTGGNLTKILKTMENTLVEKEKLKDKLKALTAQGKLSAIILTFMPYGVAAFISMTSPGYLNPLFEGMGLYILVYAITSSIFGWIIVNKIIKVD